MALREPNGRDAHTIWPDLDPARPPSIRDFPDAWRRICEALDFIRGVVMRTQGDAKQASANSSIAIDHLRKLDEKFDALATLRAPVPELPPPRPETPSTVDFRERVVKQAVKQASGEFEAIARSSEGPDDVVQAPTKKLTAIAQAAVEKALAEQAAAATAKANAERLAAIDAKADKARKDRQKIVVAGVTAFVVAVGGGAGVWSCGKTQGAIEGHQAALREHPPAATPPVIP